MATLPETIEFEENPDQSDDYNPFIISEKSLNAWVQRLNDLKKERGKKARKTHKKRLRLQR